MKNLASLFPSAIHYPKRLPLYLIPEVAIGAYFHGRSISFVMRYFSEYIPLATAVNKRLFSDYFSFIGVE